MAATGGDPSDARLPRQDGDMVPAGATEHTASPTRDAAPWAAQPSAWLHCCWCHIGVICGRFPPAAETILRDQLVAHRRRQGEGPRINAPPPPDGRLEGEGVRFKAPPPELLNQRREEGRPRIKAPPPVAWNGR